jgi:hypothetical protein
MLVLNLWGSNATLKQLVASKVEYSLAALGFFTQRVPSTISPEDTLDFQHDAAMYNTDVLIIENPYALGVSHTKAEEYYIENDQSFVDVFIPANNVIHCKRDAALAQIAEQLGVLGLIVPEHKPHIMARYIVDDVMEALKKLVIRSDHASAAVK